MGDHGAMTEKHDDLAFIMGEVYGYLRDNRHLLPRDKYKAQPMAALIVAQAYGEWLESDETDIMVWVTENYMGDAEYKRAIQTAQRIFTEDIL